MATDEKKKRTYGASIEAEGDRYEQSVQESAEQLRQDKEKAMEDYSAASESALSDIQAANEEEERSFADIARGIQEKYDKEAQEADRLQEQEKTASKWMAVTEMAGSLANLASVSAGANNQNAKSYTKDWMHVVDERNRYRRQRLDRLSERKDAINQQLASLRQSHAGSLAQFRLNNNAKLAGMREGIADDAARSRMQGAQIRYNTGIAAAKAAHDDQMRRESENRADARAAAQRDATLLTYGFVKDPKAEGGYRYDASIAARGNRKSDGSGKGFRTRVTVGGKDYSINIDENTYKNAVLNGKGHLRKDILAQAKAANGGKEVSWEELASMKKDKKNPLWQFRTENEEIISALGGTGDRKTDNETIASYIERNGSNLDNFNLSLVDLSTGASSIPSRESGPEGTASEEPAWSRGLEEGPEDEAFMFGDRPNGKKKSSWEDNL